MSDTTNAANSPESALRAYLRPLPGRPEKDRLAALAELEYLKGERDAAREEWGRMIRKWDEDGKEIARLVAENERLRRERDDFEQRLHAYKNGEMA